MDKVNIKTTLMQVHFITENLDEYINIHNDFHKWLDKNKKIILYEVLNENKKFIIRKISKYINIYEWNDEIYFSLIKCSYIYDRKYVHGTLKEIIKLLIRIGAGTAGFSVGGIPGLVISEILVFVGEKIVDKISKKYKGKKTKINKGGKHEKK